MHRATHFPNIFVHRGHHQVQINHFKNVFKVKFMGSNFVVSIIISNITSSGVCLATFNRIDNFFLYSLKETKEL